MFSFFKEAEKCGYARDKVKVVIQQHRDRSQEVRKTPFCLKFADFVKLGLFFTLKNYPSRDFPVSKIVPKTIACPDLLL